MNETILESASKKVAPQTFLQIEPEQLRAIAEDYHARGWRFANICGSTIDGGVEVLYSFCNCDELENLRVNVPNGMEMPAISDLYFNAFVFENETHDLFGVKFAGMAIDFGGRFYDVSVPTPMNPGSATAVQEATANDAGAAAAAEELTVDEQMELADDVTTPEELAAGEVQ